MLAGGFFFSSLHRLFHLPQIVNREPGTETPKPLFLVGPTGSGKSALALALAERIGGEIVNADAFQIYRGLDLCTAKPGIADRARVPHHLYDLLAPTELCDAQFYSELAAPIISDVCSRSRTPIIVGGSGLYVKALTHGLAPVPPGDEGLREQLAALTPHERIEWLLVRDPQAADTVNLKNDRYVTRALEICVLSGKAQSTLRKEWRQNEPVFQGICLVWDRATLYERINQRVLTMIESGLVEEINNACALSGTAAKAIGVREMRAHLNGECTLEEAIAAMQQSSRHYAKRQMTWFKRETGFKTMEMNADMKMHNAVDTVLAIFPSLSRNA